MGLPVGIHEYLVAADESQRVENLWTVVWV